MGHMGPMCLIGTICPMCTTGRWAPEEPRFFRCLSPFFVPAMNEQYDTFDTSLFVSHVSLERGK
jgi:hypothetical protein